MAPEVEEGQRATTASDMYSFGRLLEETKSFHSPNEALDQLIQRLLRKEPKERPSPSQVLADPYFTKSLLADQLEILKKTKEFLQQQVALQKRESELEEERKKVGQDLEGMKKQKEELEKMKRETEGEKQKYETEKKKLLTEEQRVKIMAQTSKRSGKESTSGTIAEQERKGTFDCFPIGCCNFSSLLLDILQCSSSFCSPSHRCHCRDAH